jgi:hypothetical protein
VVLKFGHFGEWIRKTWIFEVWYWGKMEKISWKDSMKNVEM